MNAAWSVHSPQERGPKVQMSGFLQRRGVQYSQFSPSGPSPFGGLPVRAPPLAPARSEPAPRDFSDIPVIQSQR